MDVHISSVSPHVAGTICLLDDDPSMLKALDRLLSSAGLQARLFSEPLDFLSFVIHNSVAVAGLDLWVLGKNGLEGHTKLQIVLPNQRVILSTADDHDSLRKAAVDT